MVGPGGGVSAASWAVGGLAYVGEGWEPTDRREVPEGPERSGVAYSPTAGATNGSGGGHPLKIQFRRGEFWAGLGMNFWIVIS